MPFQPGTRQTEILALLANGAYSLPALIEAVAPGRSSTVLSALSRLQAKGLITVTGRQSHKHVGAVVALTQPPVSDGRNRL